MDQFIESLINQQFGLIIIGVIFLILYRKCNDWSFRFLIGILLLILTLTLFASAETVLIVAKAKNASESVAASINISKFLSSVVWAAISVGLILHSVTYERKGDS